MDNDPYHYDRDADFISPIDWLAPEDAIESKSRLRVWFLTTTRGYTVVKQVIEPVITFFGGVKGKHRYYLRKEN